MAPSTVGVFKSRLTTFTATSLVGRKCKISGDFETYFVRRNPWHCRTNIILLDKLIKSAMFHNDFKKSSI